MRRTHYDPIVIPRPENKISANGHLSSIKRTLVVSGTAPLMNRTRSLSRYFSANSVIRADVAELDSEGLIATALPAAIAPACKNELSSLCKTTPTAEGTYQRSQS